MGNDDQLQALERLAKLRDTGALSEEEFTAKKTALLNSPVDARAPFYRRLWFVVLLTCLILTFPIALIILSTGDIYRYKGSTFVPVSKTARRIYAALLALWLAALVIQAIFFPSVLKRNMDEAVETPGKPAAAAQTQATAAPALAPDACDGSDVADMVKSAIENNATSKIILTKLLDFGHAKELFFDKKNNARYCNADAELNTDTGSSKLSYKLYFGPSGGELVEIRVGEDAYNTQLMALAAAQAARPSTPPTPQQEPTQAAQDQAPGLGSTTATSAKDPQNVIARYSDVFSKCMGSGEAAQGYSGGMIKCLDAEIDYQNTKYAAVYHAIYNALDPDKAASFKAQEMAWADGLDKGCEAAADNGQIDPVAKPHCVLITTVERTIMLEKLTH